MIRARYAGVIGVELGIRGVPTAERFDCRALLDGFVRGVADQMSVSSDTGRREASNAAAIGLGTAVLDA
ncbi:hypothetical protein [Streptomyces sp. NPDC050564]|uniref:hypothetical protein n=1 Tax=Streptomyces sp. NPDC050564 TaxID=3365631 RepID=UPI00379D4906